MISSYKYILEALYSWTYAATCYARRMKTSTNRSFVCLFALISYWLWCKQLGHCIHHHRNNYSLSCLFSHCGLKPTVNLIYCVGYFNICMGGYTCVYVPPAHTCTHPCGSTCCEVEGDWMWHEFLQKDLVWLICALIPHIWCLIFKIDYWGIQQKRVKIRKVNYSGIMRSCRGWNQISGELGTNAAWTKSH